MKTEKIDWSDPKYKDPMEELYAIRRQISAQYGHDVHKVFTAACKRQQEEEARGVKYIRLPIVRWGKVQPSSDSKAAALA